MIGSLRNLMFKPHISHIIFVVNVKFPWATYHLIVPSTEELYCLNNKVTSTKKVLNSGEFKITRFQYNRVYCSCMNQRNSSKEEVKVKTRKAAILVQVDAQTPLRKSL